MFSHGHGRHRYRSSRRDHPFRPSLGACRHHCADRSCPCRGGIRTRARDRRQRARGSQVDQSRTTCALPVTWAAGQRRGSLAPPISWRPQPGADVACHKNPPSGWCHPAPMSREPKWRRSAVSIDYWLLSELVAESFIAGRAAAVRTLVSRSPRRLTALPMNCQIGSISRPWRFTHLFRTLIWGADRWRRLGSGHSCPRQHHRTRRRPVHPSLASERNRSRAIPKERTAGSRVGNAPAADDQT